MDDTPRIVHLPAVMAETLGISRSEGRRLITQGGVKLNDTVEVVNADLSVSPGDFVRVGKRRGIRFDADCKPQRDPQ